MVFIFKLKALSESYGWVDEIASRAIIELKKTADILEELHRVFFHNFGISHTKFNVLVILYKGAREGMMLSEIGEQMLVTKANITGLIDRLEKQGFVKRVRDDIDRRKIMARITDKGSEFTAKVIESYKQWTKNIMAVLEDSEKDTMVRTLLKLQRGLIELDHLKGGLSDES